MPRPMPLHWNRTHTETVAALLQTAALCGRFCCCLSCRCECMACAVCTTGMLLRCLPRWCRAALVATASNGPCAQARRLPLLPAMPPDCRLMTRAVLFSSGLLSRMIFLGGVARALAQACQSRAWLDHRVCVAWRLSAIACPWLTVKKTMIRFRHKQMPMWVPVIQIIEEVLARVFATAMGLQTMACAGPVDAGQTRPSVDDSRSHAAAVCVSVDRMWLGSGARTAMRVRAVSPGLLT